MTDWTDRTAPSNDEIEAIARQVIATLPAAGGLVFSTIPTAGIAELAA